MTLFHLNRYSQVEECASLNECRIGGPSMHYTTRNAAELAVESPTAPASIAAGLEETGVAPRDLVIYIRRRFKWTENELRLIVFVDECYSHYAGSDEKAVDELLKKIDNLHYSKTFLSPRELKLLKFLLELRGHWLSLRR